jgi:hypothetical protein
VAASSVLFRMRLRSQVCMLWCSTVCAGFAGLGLRVGYWVAVSVGWSVWSRRLCMTGVGLRCCVRVSALLACAGIIFVFVFGQHFP